MNAIAAAAAGFLMAVVWFDLMFDVQVRVHRGDAVPEEVLASISRYYRRVTTEATPMNRLVSLAMTALLLSVAFEIGLGMHPAWIAWGSLAAGAGAIGLAIVRTVRDAVRLGRTNESVEVRSRLARSVYRDHVYCFALMVTVAGMQVAAAFLAPR